MNGMMVANTKGSIEMDTRMEQEYQHGPMVKDMKDNI